VALDNERAGNVCYSIARSTPGVETPARGESRVLDLGMNPDEVIGTTIPHADFGKPDCCGCLVGIIRGEEAEIVCNECAAVIRTVPAAELQQTLTEMELTLDCSSALCPHCGAANLFPGFSRMIAFTCRECGRACYVQA
jgi:hypothetical protein